ncbi:MAG TPA: hypothetical protein VHB18_10885 [Mycobacteriales bacterium]|jgi:hypothetical protein|nr:hypothetical protein [Mycobacteriales bacterium]
MRTLAVLISSVTVGATLAAAPAGLASAPRDVPQVVTSVALQTTSAPVTSSTGHKLHLTFQAHHIPNANIGDDVTVSLSSGTSDKSEFHDWRFPVDGSVIALDSTGSGTIDVPSSELAPYGTIDLQVTPVGNPTTQSCKGSPTSQTQKVTIAGTFTFVTKSSGAHKWGSVTLESLSGQVVSTYATGLGCIDFNVPCLSGTLWQANQDNLGFTGVTSGKKGSLFASREKILSQPTGATRSDEAFATTKKLTLKKSGGGAVSLSVTAAGNSSGTASLKAKHATPADSVHCRQGGKQKVETSTNWNNAKYKNGKKRLTVHEQIFGSIKISNNSNSQITVAKIT